MPNISMQAKLTVQSVKLMSYGEELEFSAIYSGTPEDNNYSEATPTASAKLMITNKALHNTFKPGQQFYVRFEEAPPKT